MTYKTRQEVLRAAADWMDICEAAGIDVAVGKYAGDKDVLENMAFDGAPKHYEFPLALLEGKEVWVGSEVCDEFGRFVHAEEFNGLDLKADGRWYNLKQYSWNPPKPKTVMVEMLVEDAEYYAKERELPLDNTEAMIERRESDCKKALENLSGGIWYVRI